MTLAQITALIAANIDTTGRRLTTGVRMREVLNAVVAYLTGIPNVAWDGLVFQNGAILTALTETLAVTQGGSETYGIQLTFSRGKEWGEVSVTGTGDSEFTASSFPTTLAVGSNQAVATVTLDTSTLGTYTFDITAGGITKTLTIEVEGA
jgi:hypothetical protein